MVWKPRPAWDKNWHMTYFCYFLSCFNWQIQAASYASCELLVSDVATDSYIHDDKVDHDSVDAISFGFITYTSHHFVIQWFFRDKNMISHWWKCLFPLFVIWRCFLLMSWVKWGLVIASAPMRRWIEFVSCESSHNIEDNTVSIDRSIVYTFYILHNRLYWYRVYSIVNAWAAMRSWVGSQSLFSKGGQRTLRHLKGWNDNDDHNFLEW